MGAHDGKTLQGDGEVGRTTTTEPRSLFRAVTRPNGRAYFEGAVMFVHASVTLRFENFVLTQL